MANSNLNLSLPIRLNDFKELLGEIKGMRVLGVITFHGAPITEFLSKQGAHPIILDYETRQEHYEGIKQIHADALRLPFPDSQFDIVVSEDLISILNTGSRGYVKDPTAFFQETLRVLVPNGHYISNDYGLKVANLEEAGLVDVKPIISNLFLYARKP